jgi:hypothetical protein
MEFMLNIKSILRRKMDHIFTFMKDSSRRIIRTDWAWNGIIIEFLLANLSIILIFLMLKQSSYIIMETYMSALFLITSATEEECFSSLNPRIISITNTKLLKSSASMKP